MAKCEHCGADIENIGRWKTRKLMLDWKTGMIEDLEQAIEDMINEYEAMAEKLKEDLR
jgi:hypothetical protein